ncbi:hypothetical protein ONE63_011544 [Megalurothrips usitatus]|uniref:Uncharacterized protein n=1 Tax=Megalurothrips usitatus TaxID=439358 RepID=A0AAV7X1J9_9NEOP|nr:hypothetical protein ONE63_011544 [Megalurothrips usitatus]
MQADDDAIFSKVSSKKVYYPQEDFIVNMSSKEWTVIKPKKTVYKKKKRQGIRNKEGLGFTKVSVDGVPDLRHKYVEIKDLKCKECKAQGSAYIATKPDKGMPAILHLRVNNTQNVPHEKKRYCFRPERERIGPDIVNKSVTEYLKTNAKTKVSDGVSGPTLYSTDVLRKVKQEEREKIYKSLDTLNELAWASRQITDQRSLLAEAGAHSHRHCCRNNGLNNSGDLTPAESARRALNAIVSCTDLTDMDAATVEEPSDGDYGTEDEDADDENGPDDESDAEDDTSEDLKEILSKLRSPFPTGVSASVEGYYNEMKNNIFKNETLPIDIDMFVGIHLAGIGGHMAISSTELTQTSSSDEGASNEETGEETTELDFLENWRVVSEDMRETDKKTATPKSKAKGETAADTAKKSKDIRSRGKVKTPASHRKPKSKNETPAADLMKSENRPPAEDTLAEDHHKSEQKSGEKENRRSYHKNTNSSKYLSTHPQIELETLDVLNPPKDYLLRNGNLTGFHETEKECKVQTEWRCPQGHLDVTYNVMLDVNSKTLERVGFQNLKAAIIAHVTSEEKDCQTENCKEKSKGTLQINETVFIDTGFLQDEGESKGPQIELTKIQINMTIGGRKFMLVGLVVHKPQHYQAYARRLKRVGGSHRRENSSSGTSQKLVAGNPSLIRLNGIDGAAKRAGNAVRVTGNGGVKRIHIAVANSMFSDCPGRARQNKSICDDLNFGNNKTGLRFAGVTCKFLEFRAVLDVNLMSCKISVSFINNRVTRLNVLCAS